MTREQIQAIIDALAGAATVIAPGHAASVVLITGLIQAGTKLHSLIEQLRTDDPAAFKEAWEATSADFRENHAAFLASMKKTE